MVRKLLTSCFVIEPSALRPLGSIELDALAVPLAVCGADGSVESATRPALELMRKLAVLAEVPGPLPRELWRALDRVGPGAAVEWRSPRRPDQVLGCTRYAAGGGFVVLMREISDKRAALSRKFYRQKLEVTSRLVARVAHELRSSVSSIVYSADFLDVSGPDLTPRELRSTLQDVAVASRQLQITVDGMLDHVRLGPGVSIPVDLRDVLARTERSVRDEYPTSSLPALHTAVAPDAVWVRGNPLSVEEVVVGLLSNAIEAGASVRSISVTTAIARRPGTRPDGTPYVRIRVQDDGDGVRAELMDRIFEPFFTTKEHGAGLGLTASREAAEAMDGCLLLEEPGPGACFSLFLPGSDAG